MHFVTVLCCLATLGSVGASAPSQLGGGVEQTAAAKDASSTLMVKLKPSGQMMTAAAVENVLNEVSSETGLQDLGPLASTDERADYWHLFRVPTGLSMDSAKSLLQEKGLPVATNDLVHSLRAPDDPMYATQKPQWDIMQMEAAWLIGTEGAPVCIIDSGKPCGHPDFNAPGNAVDFTGDGVCDRVDGHGSHVAGIVGASTNNTNGVAGGMWAGVIHHCRLLDDTGSGTAANVVKCFNWCAEQGAKVSSNSYGGYTFNQAIKDAVAAFSAAGGFSVFSSGNDNNNNDVFEHYPSGYDVPSTLTVGSTTGSGQESSFSNFGATSVDLFATGSQILSLGLLGDYVRFSGTSMAAPVVSAVAALLINLRPDWTGEQVRNALLSTVTPRANLRGRCVSGGILNAGAAMASAGTASVPHMPPSPPAPPPPPPPPADGTLQLAGGLLPWEGRVEVWEGGQPQLVCDDLWDTRDAAVVCRELGLPTTRPIAVGGAAFGTRFNAGFAVDNAACYGTEQKLADCIYSTSHDCDEREAAGVSCPPNGQSSGRIRLRDGPNAYTGRLEVMLGHEWGVVCDDLFSRADAAVACRELGLDTRNAQVLPQSPFGAGSGPILMDDVSCNGDESALWTCSFRRNHNCDFTEIVGISCPPAVPPADPPILQPLSL